MIFLEPIYHFVVNSLADKVNHFPLIRLIFFSLDKTILYFLIFAVLRLTWLLVVKKRRPLKSEFAVWLLTFYLFLLLALTVFRDSYYPWELKFYFNRPFSAINLHFLGETLKLTHGASILDFFYNSLGNVLWFAPFGLLYPIVRQKRRFFWQTLFSGFLLSVSIEAFQFILWTGISDIDDIFFNLLGTLLGYLIFLIFHAKQPHR